jgi:hypothetical protein
VTVKVVLQYRLGSPYKTLPRPFQKLGKEISKRPLQPFGVASMGLVFIGGQFGELEQVAGVSSNPMVLVTQKFHFVLIEGKKIGIPHSYPTVCQRPISIDHFIGSNLVSKAMAEDCFDGTIVVHDIRFDENVVGGVQTVHYFESSLCLHAF